LFQKKVYFLFFIRRGEEVEIQLGKLLNKEVEDSKVEQQQQDKPDEGSLAEENEQLRKRVQILEEKNEELRKQLAAALKKW